MPLIEDNNVIGNCRSSSINHLMFNKIFKRTYEYSDSVKERGTFVTLRYIKLKDASYCTIDLYNKYWADYDVDFS